MVLLPKLVSLHPELFMEDFSNERPGLACGIFAIKFGLYAY